MITLITNITIQLAWDKTNGTDGAKYKYIDKRKILNNGQVIQTIDSD